MEECRSVQHDITRKMFTKMAESIDIKEQTTKPHTHMTEADNVRSNAQEYLRLLIDREGKIEAMLSTLQAKDLEIQDLRSRLDEKDKAIESLRNEIDELRTALHDAKNYDNKTFSRILPLMPHDARDGDQELSTPSAPAAAKQRRKPVRIDDEVIARLKNDRKAYPVVCDKALHYWTLLIDADLIDHRLKPTSRCGVSVMARIVSRMQTEVDPAISWAFFERYWKCDHIQSNLHRETYKHRKYYATVNRIFGLADDAPYLTKSSQAV